MQQTTFTESPAKGDYFVIVTVNSCVSEKSNVIFVNQYNSIGETINSGIELYPNPTAGLLEISAANPDINKFNYIIYNDLGATIVVKLSYKDEHTVQIDLTSYPSGIYMVKMYNKNTQQLFKVIKK